MVPASQDADQELASVASAMTLGCRATRSLQGKWLFRRGSRTLSGVLRRQGIWGAARKELFQQCFPDATKFWKTLEAFVQVNIRLRRGKLLADQQVDVAETLAKLLWGLRPV